MSPLTKHFPKRSGNPSLSALSLASTRLSPARSRYRAPSPRSAAIHSSPYASCQHHADEKANPLSVPIRTRGVEPRPCRTSRNSTRCAIQSRSRNRWEIKKPKSMGNKAYPLDARIQLRTESWGLSQYSWALCVHISRLWGPDSTRQWNINAAVREGSRMLPAAHHHHQK